MTPSLTWKWMKTFGFVCRLLCVCTGYNAASVEVKQVIGTLLAATGLDAVPAPETFRRASFRGGPEVLR